jgi:hypothetical protein
MESKGMELITDNGIFFEFVSYNSSNFDNEGNIKSNPEVVSIKDVEEDKEYAILISTCSGAWRYLIGDIVKFISKEKSIIVITGRTKQFLSICGEHLSIDNMTRAIEMVENDLNVEIREFTVVGIEYESLFAHKWYLGSDNEFDSSLARKKIDEYLKILNDDYRVERIEAIKEVFVEILPMKAFTGWMKMKGKEGGAHKFPRVLNRKMYLEWEEYLKDNYYPE